MERDYSARTGKGKNDKMIYLFGNQLIAKEKMGNWSKICVLIEIFLRIRVRVKNKPRQLGWGMDYSFFKMSYSTQILAASVRP